MVAVFTAVKGDAAVVSGTGCDILKAPPPVSIELVKQIRQWDVKPDVVSYSAAISACEKGAARLLPFELLKEIQKWDISYKT